MAQSRKNTTTKKNTPKESTQAITGDELDLSNAKEPDLVPGDTISLNAKVNPYFGVAQIWLSPEAYWARVPDDLTPEEMNILSKGLKAGKIVKGKVHIPVIDKTTRTPESYWELVKASREALNDDVKRMFRHALEVDQVDGWTAYEIADYCLTKESRERNRPRIMSALQEVKNLHRGPTRIPYLEAYDSPEGIKQVKIGARHIAEDTGANTTGSTQGGRRALDQLFE